jgi:hypothetical protein
MNDHLDRTTSVSVALTETGVQAKAQSRFVAAVDRLGGNLIEMINAPMERRVLRQRAVSSGETELVAAVVKFGIEKLNSDPAFAERTAERYFTRVFQKQENKDGVLREALEDLRHDGSSDGQAVEASLSGEFLDRLEHYAEGASTEQLKQKWGHVLSAEIKRPGTFSAKVMRIVDELDSATALLFEQISKSTFNGIVPKCLIGILKFHELVRLVAAGLLVDPGITGHIAEFTEVQSNAGKELWTLSFPNGRSVSIPKGTKLEAMALPDFTGPVQLNGELAAMPAYLMTEVGGAISTIFSVNDAPERYVNELRKALPDVEIVEYQADAHGHHHALSQSTPGTKRPSIDSN